MAKISFDKYYTDQKIADYCTLKTQQTTTDITNIIEPSAGNGRFLNSIESLYSNTHYSAYDILPDDKRVIQQDFLDLEIPYEKGTLIIGNPPFGNRNSLSVKFFKHSVNISDYIAFILPVSQYNNNQQMYEFDLIHSEVLPLIEFSGRKLLCCFNIYKRPLLGINKTKIDYKLKDITILEWRRGGSYSKPISYDIGICSCGASIGKEIEKQGQYALENYIIVNRPELKERVIKLMLEVDWCGLYPNIATPRLGQWKIYKYLKEQIPELI